MIIPALTRIKGKERTGGPGLGGSDNSEQKGWGGEVLTRGMEGRVGCGGK